MDTKIIGLEQVYPDEYTREIVLISMYCFEIKKDIAKDCLNIVKNYINNQLYNNYNHLKRCKKTQDHVEILIGLSKDLPENLLKELKKVNNGEDIKIKKINVSKYEPLNKKQYSEWSSYWPTYYRRPTDESSNILTKQQIENHIKFLNISINIGNKFGTCQSGCVLTFNNKIIACSGDNIKNHPLHHSVMLAIEDVAFKLRNIWRFKKNKKMKNCENNDENNDENGDENNAVSNLNFNQVSSHKNDNYIDNLFDKKKKKVTHQNSDNNELCALNIDRTKIKEENNSTCDKKMDEDILENCINSNNVINSDQYLCTNYYAYLTHEPCFMCAMAMVHSRIKCVIFDKVNKENGALFSRGKLHCLKSLNHHFKVYKTVREKC
ncbi:cytidine/deoxycytidylate deaminase [Plasmodium yoelii]|uniref:Cytidine deaminase n=3 Tax=Plasmodium yoelii TaxID=5861 RepID=A0AAE9WKW2_PLAYO|nr:cytidine/deoxycytidylate deaminase [Plasmodium yoelii]EAA16616.1 Cytidine and deoxycytidylate deaminase zinc-binding region, putative [Plasmodium yoelii yoelii]WBY55923.1 cytidine deaminase [Plasmodium yoelii yoelii]CDU16913.1 cytidine deaminase, putative [Plasmodium yoelii]VTZ75200.1 cytidine deaminase, putative [Plasmodium yoelii]|eukprot:XP_725051.1 cytidine/deoxycytidylate deaminase [Plasmodium yoelii]